MKIAPLKEKAALFCAAAIVILCNQNILSSNAFQTIRPRYNSNSNSPLLQSCTSSTKLYNRNGRCYQDRKQQQQQQRREHIPPLASAGSKLDIISRRNIFKVMSASASSIPLQFLVSPPPKRAEAATGDSSIKLPNGLLETRVLENVLSPPPYGIETSDIQYPRYE